VADESKPRRASGGEVAGGLVVGLVVTFLYMTVIFVATLDTTNAHGSTADNGLVFVLSVLPFLGSILLLCFRRTRQAGAGFVMGFAIGTLVPAGLCTSSTIPGLVS
jgi:hypothetical protein